MRHESSITSISWIPSEAMTGPMRVPMDLHIGHYDQAPPDKLGPGDLEKLRDDDRYRFANRLGAWIQTESGVIEAAGYSGRGYIGSTTAKVGLSVTIPGVSFPVIQEQPIIDEQKAVFRQTSGGRTGAPLPHRIERPPYVRMTAPVAWTSLQLTIHVDGSAEYEMVGASPFPRHWVYGPDGSLVAKSGLIDFAKWVHDDDSGHTHTPWHDFDYSVLMSDVESELERQLSRVVMTQRPEILRLEPDITLIEQGQPGGSIYLILDGMLRVEVDDSEVAELGPGAIVGERAILEGGHATATVRTTTPTRAARISGDVIPREDLEGVAARHRQEGAST